MIQDFRLSYAGQVSANKRAQFSVVAWSGKGVVRNYAGSAGPTMPQLFPQAIANDPNSTWDFSLFVPTVVVVFLGANDYSTPPAPSYASFSAGYNVLLNSIEAAYVSHNPNLRIVCTCGPFDVFCYNGGQGPSYVERIVAARNDSRVSFVSLDGVLPNPSYPGPYTGCDGHPNVKGAALMAQSLSSSL